MSIEFRVEVDPRQVQRALALFGPDRLDRQLVGAIDESTGVLQRMVRENMRDSVDSGNLWTQTFTRQRGSPLNREGVVGNPVEYGTVVELGRRPGSTPPPVAPIRRWAVRHGFPASAAYAIAQKIGRDGIPGVFMFARASVEGARQVGNIFRSWLGRRL